MFNVASKSERAYDLVVQLEDGVDGEIDPASLLEHYESLNGVQRCRVGR